jgi:hypothetical protein
LERFKPSLADIFLSVASGIGLDIQDRGSINHIKPGDEEPVFFPSDQPDNGDTQRIGTAGASGGEHAALPAVEGRVGDQAGSGRPVEIENYDQMGESVYVFESLNQLRQKFDFSLYIFETIGPDVAFPFDVARTIKGGVNDSYRLKLNGHDCSLF